MNSLFIAIFAFILLYLGYLFYGNFIKKIWDIDPKRKTPAIENPDKVD